MKRVLILRDSIGELDFLRPIFQKNPDFFSKIFVGRHYNISRVRNFLDNHKSNTSLFGHNLEIDYKITNIKSKTIYHVRYSLIVILFTLLLRVLYREVYVSPDSRPSNLAFKFPIFKSKT